MTKKHDLRIKDIRKMMRLRAMNYTHKEIAEEIGIPRPTVSYHFRRLRKQADKTSVDALWREYFGIGIVTTNGAGYTHTVTTGDGN